MITINLGSPEYEISSKGRIKYPIRKEKPLYIIRITEGGISGDGYKTLSLKNGNTSIKKAMCQIATDAFLTSHNNKMV